MGTLGWILIILAVALVVGGGVTAWQLFSRPPRIRSPEMKQLDEIYFAGDITREEYLRRKREIERREGGNKWL